jgi:hypothetical protein
MLPSITFDSPDGVQRLLVESEAVRVKLIWVNAALQQFEGIVDTWYGPAQLNAPPARLMS